MAVTNQFPGQIADTIASVVYENLGITGVPLGSVLRDFSGDTPKKNSHAIITTMVESSSGRRAQTYNRSSGTFPDFASDPPTVQQKEIKIYPDYYAVDEVEIPEAEASLLKSPQYIKNAIQPAAVEGCRRQVLKDFYSWFNPFNFADSDGSDVTSAGANQGIEVQFRGMQTTKGVFGVRQLADLESILFDQLMPDEDYTLLLNSEFHAGISETSDNLNWLNYTGSTESLQNKKYMRIKNFDIHRVHFLSGTNSTSAGAANSVIQREGNLISYLEPKATGGNPNFTGRPFTIPAPAGVTEKEIRGTGSWTYKNLPNGTGADTALTAAQRVKGIAFHERALAVAAWSQYSPNELIGYNPNNVQTSYFKDPVSGFPFRVMVYYRPELHKYTIEISAWYGFAVADPRAAAFVFNTA